MPKTFSRGRPRILVTYVSAPLEAGKVHIGNEEDRLGVQINEGLEHRDIHPFVRGKQWHFNIGNWGGEKR